MGLPQGMSLSARLELHLKVGVPRCHPEQLCESKDLHAWFVLYSW